MQATRWRTWLDRMMPNQTGSSSIPNASSDETSAAPVLARRRLGRTGLMVSEIGFGGWGVGGGSWGGADDQNSIPALNKAFDLGLNFVDTALVYGAGHSEKLIACVLKRRTEQIYVATKIPPKNRLWPARPGIPLRDVFPREHVEKCVNESLRNMRRDGVDLIQFHVWNEEWAEQGDWRESVEWLKQSGKARFVGISVNDHSPATVMPALRTGLIDCVQVIYNIFDPSPQEKLFPLCQQLDIGVISRVPFDEGSLTGTFTPKTSFPPGDMRQRYFGGDRMRATCERVDTLRNELGHEEPLAQTALRFCLSHPAVSTVIPGMRKVGHVEQNLSASVAGPLSTTDLEILARHRWPRNFYD
jgi:aryl-alcohol dehydrogenase-like predicted oxidoreductase